LNFNSGALKIALNGSSQFTWEILLTLFMTILILADYFQLQFMLIFDNILMCQCVTLAMINISYSLSLFECMLCITFY